jgi:hypothetical protein
MDPSSCSIGDLIVVKASLTRSARDDRQCRVVGMLPASDRGERQYRVRFGTENFERRIVASDIDRSETTANSVGSDMLAVDSLAEPWFKSSKIRIGK